MDHDRSSGEGVGVQEYTCVKLRVLIEELNALPLSSRKLVNDTPVGARITELTPLLANKTVYLVAATLRPETMYGQTNCFVGTDITYGIYSINDTELWVCTPRAARNMAYQNLFKEKATVELVATLSGWDLVGIQLEAALSLRKSVYCLPMDGVLEDKGTGIVTSVPSDSPDDYITLMDLIKKPAYYQIQRNYFF